MRSLSVSGVSSGRRSRTASVGGRRSAETVARLRGHLALDLPTPERVLEAAAIKAQHAVSYADAFAVATAGAHSAVLVTGDPEILAGDPSWQTEDLRPAT